MASPTAYDTLRPGDVVQIDGLDGTHLVVANLTTPGGGAGMGEYPPITKVVMDDGAWLVYDPWVPATKYRTFSVIGHSPLAGKLNIRPDREAQS